MESSFCIVYIVLQIMTLRSNVVKLLVPTKVRFEK